MSPQNFAIDVLAKKQNKKINSFDNMGLAQIDRVRPISLEQHRKFGMLMAAIAIERYEDSEKELKASVDEILRMVGYIL